ncbi:MAG: two-component sensor histidine kinase [Variovorax paradoxus]|uniref:histidine kinase n=1 Tax=Variovorax paradoxus TaxID=34073 RepID=A0A2W5NP70_VARPD|nr:MAG: two-component sensor histidine kinase [Variovorax paradoxus]
MWFLVLALVMAGIFLGGMKRSFSNGWGAVAQPLLMDYEDRIVAELGAPPDVAKAQALVARLPITLRISGPQVNWDSHPGEPEHGFLRDARPANGEEERWYVRQTADGHRVVFGWAPRVWEQAPRAAGWGTLAALLLLVVGVYAGISRLLRPLIDIREGAERFGRGEFETPIPIRHCDDLGDLAQRINTMAHDIRAMLDAKRTLLLAMSHELRSPLTRARLNAELLPEGGEGAAEREALLRDLGEMRELISLVREVQDELAARGVPMAQAVRLDVAPGLPTPALDRSRVRLLLRNLLDNALRHGAGGPQAPVVSLRPASADQGGGGIEVEVRDFGPGVPEEQLARLAEPFYRPDSARTRSAGGVGLGMYLCRLVAQAHGGGLTLRNAHPGLAVTALLNS